MTTKKKSKLSRSPLGAALIGGAVVGLLGWVAIAAGWVEADDGSPRGLSAPLASTRLAADGKGLSVGEIYQRVAPGVVFIEADQGGSGASPFGPDQGGGTATGSGFVVDDEGRILTNAHVVDGATEIRVKLGEEGEPIAAELVGQDTSTDVAMIKIDPGAAVLTPLELGDSSTAKVGDPVIAIGNPLGLDRTVTTGIVSALAREIRAPDGFAINPGNSGGPLFDAAGRVIGINSQIATAGGQGSIGIGFAVPINTARNVADQLADSGEVKRAFLGVSGADLNSPIADALDLDVTGGALVQEIVPDSPAEDAGLQAGDQQVDIDGQQLNAGGDVIVSVDGRQVDGMGDVVSAISSKRPGDEVTLEVVRDGERRELTVKLAERPPGETG
jgi:S1-C subfamily serine protease